MNNLNRLRYVLISIVLTCIIVYATIHIFPDSPILIILVNISTVGILNIAKPNQCMDKLDRLRYTLIGIAGTYGFTMLIVHLLPNSPMMWICANATAIGILNIAKPE